MTVRDEEASLWELLFLHCIKHLLPPACSSLAMC